MKNNNLKYSDHYETIVALVTYLALCNRYIERDKKTIDNATAWWLVKYLGLSEQTEENKVAFDAKVKEVEAVLTGYTSLFRKSNDQHEGRYRYSLLLRYARRLYKDKQDPDVSDPLSNEELFSLLDFISNKAKTEQEEKTREDNNRYQLLAMGIAVLSAVIAAGSSVYVALIGR